MSSEHEAAGAREVDPAALSRAFVDATTVLVCVVGGDGRILMANRSLQVFTGRAADELVGRFFWDVYVVPEHVEPARDAVARAMATGVAQPQEGDWLGRDGERRRVAMQNDVLLDQAGRPYAIACVGLDVTEQRQREALLAQRADTDLLTGLLNRRALFEALGRFLHPRDGAGCGVLFCDLDQFKVVNDRYGHSAGDQVLAEVAARLREVTGPEHVVARFGGDEFVVVCPEGDEGALRDLVRQVVDRVGAPYPGPDGPLGIGVSVGTALGGPGEPADELITRADRAMYGAKTHQRRRRAREDSPVRD